MLQFGLHIPKVYLIVTTLADFPNFVAVLQKKYLSKIFVHFVHSNLRCLRQQIDKNSLENMEIWKFCSGNFNICEQARAPQGGKILKCGNSTCSRYTQSDKATIDLAKGQNNLSLQF